MPPTLSMRMRVRYPGGALSGGNFMSGSPRIGLSSLEKLGRPALDDPCGSVDGEVGPHPLSRRANRHGRDGNAEDIAKERLL